MSSIGDGLRTEVVRDAKGGGGGRYVLKGWCGVLVSVKVLFSVDFRGYSEN